MHRVRPGLVWQKGNLALHGHLVMAGGAYQRISSLGLLCNGPETAVVLSRMLRGVVHGPPESELTVGLGQMEMLAPGNSMSVFDATSFRQADGALVAAGKRSLRLCREVLLSMTVVVTGRTEVVDVELAAVADFGLSVEELRQGAGPIDWKVATDDELTLVGGSVHLRGVRAETLREDVAV